MNVQIVSDVVCPWCRIGKHNLREAAKKFTEMTGEQVEVSFLPFLLDPIREEELGESFRDRFTQRKGLSEQQMDEMFARVTEVGQQYGLTFNFDKVEVAVDTVPAHELMELTPDESREQLMDALMKAYFEDGRNVGDIDTLLEIARGVLPADVVQQIEPRLRNRELKDQVLGIIGQVQQSGISSVPFAIIDNTFAVSGGQPPQAFFNALMQAQEAKRQPSE